MMFKIGDTIRPKGSKAEYTITSISGGCYHGKGWGLPIDAEKDYELVESTEDVDVCNIQYASIDGAIKAHAGDYSFNIESELFQQLTPEQQKMWRKEIERAVLSGAYSGLNLARDKRYEENRQEKSVSEELEQLAFVLPYNGRYINSYQHRFGYTVRRYERGHIEVTGIFKSPQGDVTEPEKMVIGERE